MTSPHDTPAQQDRSQAWLYVALALLLLPLAVTIYLTSNGRDSTATAPLDPACNLQREPCQSVFPNGARVSLSIEPRPIPVLRPLQIRVQTEGIDVQKVQVDFRGVDMDMGYNRPQLKAEAAGHYTGTWVLGSCGLERMVWEATVLLETAEGKLAAPFRLETLDK